MKRYSDWKPTGFDIPGLACDDRQDWWVGPVMLTRDSGCLERSNWEVIVGDLRNGDSEGYYTETHRFGHWACGWFEIILIRPDTLTAATAERWEDALSDYPVASDDHFSELEYTEACEYWASINLRERVQLLQRARLNVFAARRDEFPSDPQGRLQELVTQ